MKETRSLPAELFAGRTLIFQLAKNDFKKKYAGSYLGIVWALPLPQNGQHGACHRFPGRVRRTGGGQAERMDGLAARTGQRCFLPYPESDF